MNAGPLALEILVGFAELEVAHKDNQQALALLCLVRDHPALISETWQLATPLYETLVAASAADSQVDPCTKSRAFTLETIMDKLLD
jgi:hypothetical protein